MKRRGYKVRRAHFSFSSHQIADVYNAITSLERNPLGSDTVLTWWVKCHTISPVTRVSSPSKHLLEPGAIFFWPSAKFRTYGGFVGCTFVIGCGLSCLEVAANSYITVLGTPRYAAMRLNISQGFQGIASFAGPLIASTYFFKGKNADTLNTVQWVYLAVAGLGLTLNVLF